MPQLMSRRDNGNTITFVNGNVEGHVNIDIGRYTISIADCMHSGEFDNKADIKVWYDNDNDITGIIARSLANRGWSVDCVQPNGATSWIKATPMVLHDIMTIINGLHAL